MLTLGYNWFNTTNFMKEGLENNMKAKFSSSCVSCGDEIRRGKEIAKDDSGRWVHKHCTAEANDLP